AACGARETKPGADVLEPATERPVDRRLELRRKSGDFTVRAVNHMPREHDDAWDLEEPVDAAPVIVQLVHDQQSIAARRPKASPVPNSYVDRLAVPIFGLGPVSQQERGLAQRGKQPVSILGPEGSIELGAAQHRDVAGQ